MINWMSGRIAYEVRLASCDDNDDLCAIASRTPMIADVAVITDRSPDFFAFYDLHGRQLQPGESPHNEDCWAAAVASSNGRDVGVVAVAFRTVRCGDRTLRVAYPMDARVDPGHQRKGAFKAAWGAVRETISQADVDAGIGFILQGNRRAQLAADEVIPGGVLQEPGDFHLVHFSMYWPYKEKQRLNIERATDSDRNEIAELLDETYRHHIFVPLMDRAWLDRVVDASPGYSISDIRVVRDKGQIVALIGLWDQTPVRRLIVEKNPLQVRVGILGARLLSRFVTSPPIPKPGQPLTALYIKQIACRPGHQETLRTMMRQLLNRVRTSCAYQLVWGAFYESDPLLPLWKGFASNRSLSKLYWVPMSVETDEIITEALSKHPAYADFSMV